jgi:mono/diheme cytochrome c family protein
MNRASACVLVCVALGADFTASRGTALAVTGVVSAQGAAGSNGWYTVKQAERGKIAYEESCSTCHGASLRGGANEFAAPALAGPFFYEKWNGRPLEDLFRYAAENMPPEGTKLSEAAYLDVTAYILQVLKYPAGTSDLSAASPAMKQKIEQPRQ